MAEAVFDIDAYCLGIRVLQGEDQVRDSANALGHTAHADRPFEDL